MAKPINVTGTILWASLKKESDLSGKFQFELTNLSDAAVDAIQQAGMKVNSNADKPEKGNYLTIKSNRPIKAYDTNGDEIIADIGNGSKAVVALGSYDWVFNGKKGRSPSCLKLVVTDLEVYEPVEQVNIDVEAAL